MRPYQIREFEDYRPLAMILIDTPGHPIRALMQNQASAARTRMARISSHATLLVDDPEAELTTLMHLLARTCVKPAHLHDMSRTRLVALVTQRNPSPKLLVLPKPRSSGCCGGLCRGTKIHAGRAICAECRRVNAHGIGCSRDATLMLNLPIAARVPKHDASTMRWRQFGRAMKHLGSRAGLRLAEAFA